MAMSRKTELVAYPITGARPCRQCGGVFSPKYPHHTFCSPKCQEKFPQRKKPPKLPQPRPCGICGTIYIPFGAKSKFCSPECRKRRRNDVRRDEYVPKPAKIKRDGVCLNCGGVLIALSSKKKFCTHRCNQIFYRKTLSSGGMCHSCSQPKNCHQKNCEKCREKSKKQQKMWQRGLREEIIRHYGGGCALCGQKRCM